MRVEGKALKIVGLVAISLLIGSVVGYAIGTLQAVISEVQQPFSYTLYKEESHYYARNAFGNIEFSGTNASQVINTAFDHLTNGGTVFLRSGVYALDAPIVIDTSGSALIGESYGSVNLTTTRDIDLVYVGQEGDVVEQVYIANLVISGSDAGTSAGLYIRNAWYSKFEALNVKHNYRGVFIYGESASLSGGHLTFEDVEIEENIYAGVYQARHFSSVYRHVSSHRNGQFGFFFGEHAQGVEMYQCFASNNKNTGLYVVGVATGYLSGCQFSGSTTYPQSYGIRLRDASSHWLMENVYVEGSTYQNLVVESGTNAVVKYEATDISFINCQFVKGLRNGVQIKSNNGYNTTQIRFTSCQINNNGLHADDTYFGLYITDDGNASSCTRDIWITNCWIGNDASLGGDLYQRGMSADSNSDYIHCTNVDTSTAKTVGINVLGANCHVNLSYNLTSWVA